MKLWRGGLNGNIITDGSSRGLFRDHSNDRMGRMGSDQEAQEMEMKGSLTVKEIAEFIGKSEVFVRASIENGSLPIGSYDRKGKRANYFISPKRAYEWLGYIRHEENTDGYSTLPHVECNTSTSG